MRNSLDMSVTTVAQTFTLEENTSKELGTQNPTGLMRGDFRRF